MAVITGHVIAVMDALAPRLGDTPHCRRHQGGAMTLETDDPLNPGFFIRGRPGKSRLGGLSPGGPGKGQEAHEAGRRQESFHQ